MQMVYELCGSPVVYILMPVAIFPNSLRFFHDAFQFTASSQLHHTQCSLSLCSLLSVSITSPDNHQRM